MTRRATIVVATAPAPLMTADFCQPGVLVRIQYRTIPLCESVKAVNTPITYRWIRALTSAWKAQIRSEAIVASTMIPFE